MIRYLLALLALAPTAAFSQAWTTSAQTPTWAVPPVIGDGNNALPEVSTSTQGGDPPALAYEPAAIDENGIYTRSQWLEAASNRTDQDEAKFRITCNFSHFAADDPILAFGQPGAFHHHTFIGNNSTNHSSTYTTLRNSPSSTCSGGPLNGTGYWEPTVMKELAAGVAVPIKPDVVIFYYVLAYDKVTENYRIPRGVSFIGGRNPSDMDNTARLAEVPDGQGWDKSGPLVGTTTFDGFTGISCLKGATAALANAVMPTASEARVGTSQRSRVLVNSDGSDPWAGQCNPDVANPITLFTFEVTSPTCWDGHNLTSVGGRDHFRYPLRTSNDVYKNVCPQGWWKVPAFLAKVEFSHNGWTDYQHWYLSSDRHGLTEANWHTPGSTFHFDWMNGWDSVVQRDWMDKCTGVSQNGDTGEPLTCDFSTISDTQRMKVGTPPVSGLSNDPIISTNDYARGPSKNRFGPVEDGTVIPSTTVEHSGH